VLQVVDIPVGVELDLKNNTNIRGFAVKIAAKPLILFTQIVK